MLGGERLGRHATGIPEQPFVAGVEIGSIPAPSIDAQTEQIAEQVGKVVEADAGDVEVQLAGPEHRIRFLEHVAKAL